MNESQAATLGDLIAQAAEKIQKLDMGHRQPSLCCCEISTIYEVNTALKAIVNTMGDIRDTLAWTDKDEKGKATSTETEALSGLIDNLYNIQAELNTVVSSMENIGDTIAELDWAVVHRSQRERAG